MKLIKSSNGQFFLFINAILWGSSYVWSKMLLGYMPRFSILAVCAAAGLIVTTAVFFSCLKRITAAAFLASLAVSGFSIASNTFCMLALQYTSSSNTAFIVQLSVVMTPLVMAVVEKRMPRARVITASILALAGVFLLTADVGSLRLKAGDILALCNALFFTLYLAGQKIISTKVSPAHFTFVQHTVNFAAFLTLSVFLERGSMDFGVLADVKILLLLAASSLVVIITTLVQSASIKYVRPERAAIIYTTEPVTTAFLASALLGETFGGLRAVSGCVLILSAVVISAYAAGAGKRKLPGSRAAKRFQRVYMSQNPLSCPLR